MTFHHQIHLIPINRIRALMNLFSCQRAQKISSSLLLVICAVCVALLPDVAVVNAVMDSRFELDPRAFADPKGGTNVRKSVVKSSTVAKGKKTVSRSQRNKNYTVKPGDHLLKILMRDYGLNDSEAELFMEEVKRENNIYDITRLKAGQKLVIPPVRRLPDGTLTLSPSDRDTGRRHSGGDVPGQIFALNAPVAAGSDEEIITRVHDVWNRIVPTKAGIDTPLTLQTPAFSLTLDPGRYPTFPRMDGGRVVLDRNGSIPPLVTSLIEENDTSLQIVTETSSNPKRVIASLLEAGGFFSVEENFTMEFGRDPKLTVKTDFKIERTAESLVKQDIVLINSGTTQMPPALNEFLGKEGFLLQEPFASHRSFASGDSRTIHSISGNKQPELVDAILAALSVTPERGHRVDVFGADNNGISLAVQAERYFERGGQRYVIARFDGDPMKYTLFRILEAKGYSVVMLEAADDFRKISEKIISRMKLRGGFANHSLLQDSAAGYSVQMSGFKLDDTHFPGGGIFLTDRPIDRVVRGLFSEYGFTVVDK
jgi:hypothetical protein